MRLLTFLLAAASAAQGAVLAVLRLFCFAFCFCVLPSAHHAHPVACGSRLFCAAPWYSLACWCTALPWHPSVPSLLHVPGRTPPCPGPLTWKERPRGHPAHPALGACRWALCLPPPLPPPPGGRLLSSRRRGLPVSPEPGLGEPLSRARGPVPSHAGVRPGADTQTTAWHALFSSEGL